MTDDAPLTPQEADDVLAAEYVLGLLDGDEWRKARDRAETDGEFATRVQAWEARLAPLNAEFPEVEPPDRLPAIEAQLFPAREPRSRRRWLTGFGLGSAVAAMLLVVIFIAFPPTRVAPPALPPLQAELVDAERGLTLLVGYTPETEALSVTTTGPEAEAGSVYELWVIDETGVPRSLGLLADVETQLTARLEAGQTLAVSLEPEGGSPEPEPTGPVLATAPLDAT